VLATVEAEAAELADKFGDARRTSVRARSCHGVVQIGDRRPRTSPSFFICGYMSAAGRAQLRGGYTLHPAGCFARRVKRAAGAGAQVCHDAGDGELTVEDVTPNTASLLVFSRRGYLKRMRADLFSPQVLHQMLRSAIRVFTCIRA